MKKIILIGASGFVGSAILKEALSRGISVKAVVRDPAKITIEAENLKVENADIFSIDSLATISRGSDAVISAYNPGWSNPNIADETLEGYKAIITAVKKSGVKRFLVVGGAGSLLVDSGKMVLDTGVIPDQILPGVKALAQLLKDYFLPEKDLDWVFFSPAGTIESGERTGKYRLGTDHLVVDDKGVSKISVQDYAKAMIDEFENPQHHQQRFTIGY